MTRLQTFFYILLLSATGSLPLNAQNIKPTSDQERMTAIHHRQKMRKSSIFKDYPVRNVGPVVMSGRVTDVAVVQNHPTHYYVAYASGGVFKTTNDGTTMHPVFDEQGTLTIGDIAISRADSSVIWVGTGENNSSRQSYAGNGIYRSADGGKTWIYAGLTGSQHIGRIVTSPTDPQTAWVASLGPLYSENDVRGVYKTTDGGQTWKRTLTPPDSTGVIDLVIDPKNPQRLWAATWQRFRQAWNFDGDGEGSAIYISNDGGETWKKSMTGFPSGPYVGRIGLDVCASNPNVIYAYLDNQKKVKPEKKTNKTQLTKKDFLNMSKKEFLKLDNKKLNNFLKYNGFPQKYDAVRVKNDVRHGLYKPKALAKYLGNANSREVSNSVTGAQVYRSNNGGHTWKKVNEYSLSNVVHTYGYYFGQIRVSPSNPDIVYIGGVPELKSTDGGRTWDPIGKNQPVHADKHALWIDPHNPKHLLLGTDGGLYESYDGGANFIHHNSVPVAQFYKVAVDMDKPYHIYGGMQDNGVFMGSSQSSPNDNKKWKRLLGGDGMHVAVDPKNSNIVYAGFQFGNYFRINRSTGKHTRITPEEKIGQEKLRFNWNTPIRLSPQDPNVIYMGSQYLHRSFNRGNSWRTISPDLTNEKKSQQKGNVPYSTITTIAPSPLRFNEIWVGTDDGNVQLTRDGGRSWQLVSQNLPQKRWISHIEASPHDAATAFVSLNGYRYDEFKTYLYKTVNYGQTWTSVKGNLPESVANVILQDPQYPQVLYAGLDAGTFISFNDGKKWFLLNGVPNVPAYDMVIQPRAEDLVIGTHGRSVYVANLKPIHTVAGHLDKSIIALKTKPIQYSANWGNQPVKYRPVHQPHIRWMYWIGNKKARNKPVKILIQDSTGHTVTKLKDRGSYGFNTINWNLKLGKNHYLGKGTYTIIYKYHGKTDTTSFHIIGNRNNHGAGERMLPSQEEKQGEFK